MKKNEITYKELHEKFIYIAEAGLLINKKSKKSVGYLTREGYLFTKINKKPYFIHRIVYCMYHGYFPENQIDHINRIKNDNRIWNLREVSCSCNIRNTGNSRTNTSGVKGVTWIPHERRWRATITYKKKNCFIGHFKNFINAVKARNYAEQKFNYHLCNSESPSTKYLKNVNNINFHTNINIENEKEIKKDSVSSEWEFFCFTSKKKIDKLAET